MIAVKIQGGLGNQMFQYAFAYATAKKLNAPFYLDETTDVFKCSKYFQISEALWLTWLRKVYLLKGMHYLLKGAKHSFYAKWASKHQLKSIAIIQSSASALELNKIENQAIYSGFYQAENYFIAQKEDIVKQFTIKQKYQAMFFKMAATIKDCQKLVCVHVRRSDYHVLGWDLPLSYYLQAIESVQAPQNHYVFISDEPHFVAQHFAHISPKTITANQEIIDFQFLLHSDINILSNSSFSWWGAYLNTKKALTIAPKNWLGKEVQYPNGITLAHWKLI